MVVVFICRCVNQRTHARTRHTTVTNMLNAFTSVTSVTPCTSASVGLVMLEMASFVEKTQTWMVGPIRTLCVVQMPHITARRYFLSLYTAVVDIKPYCVCKTTCYVSRIIVLACPTLDKKTLTEMAKETLVTRMTTTMEF